MRLLLFTDYFVPHHGGTATYFYEVARRLSQFDVTIVTRQLPLAPSGLHPPLTVLYTPFPPIPKVRMLVEFFAQVMTGLWLVLRHRVRIVLSGQAFPLGLAAYAIHVVTRVPFAVFVHGEEITKFTARPHTRALLRFILGRAGAVFAASIFSAQLVNALGIRSDRIHIVHPAVDSLAFRPVDGTALRARLGGTNKKVLLTVGRLIPRKGQDTIIRLLPRIAREIPDIVYWIAGKGPTGSRPHLEALARMHGVQDRVRFLDDVPAEEMCQLYSACDVFLMLNRTTEDGDVEGFGIVFLEASACGKAVIAGRSGGTSEAVQDGLTGFLIPEGDDATATAACVRLLNDGRLREGFGTNGRRWVIQHFSWDTTAARVTAVSLALAGGRVLAPGVVIAGKERTR